MSTLVKSMDLSAVVGNAVVTTSNTGGGDGLALPLVGTDAPFKSLVAGANILITSSATEITIATASTVGEANTTSNSGTGAGLAQTKSGVDLPFKSLIGETDRIVLTENTDDVTFALGADVAFVDETNTFTQLNTFEGGIHNIQDGGSAAYIARSFDTGVNPSEFSGFFARGSESSPTAVQADDVLLRLIANGQADFERIGAIIDMVATEAWTGISTPTKIEFYTVASSSTSTTLQLEIGPDGNADFQNNNINNVRIFSTASANLSSTGSILLGNAEVQSWRNAADDGDISILASPSDTFDIVIGLATQYAFGEGEADYNTNSITNLFNETMSGAQVFFDDSTQDQAAIPTDITWNIPVSNFTGNSFSTVGEDSFSSAASFKSDGLTILVVGAVNNIVSQYTLTTAWDASTATFTQSFDLSNEANFPRGLFVRHDGKKLYIADSSPTDDVFEYDLATAWDVSTMSFSGNSFSVTTQEATPSGISFKPDGSKMYVVGNASGNVNEYDLTTNWDVSTSSFSQSFSVTGEDSNPLDMAFKPDGKAVYIVGSDTDIIVQYALTTAWDVSTMVFNSQTFDVSSEDTGGRGIAFRPNGSKFYLVGGQNNNVYEYNIGIEVIGIINADTINADIANVEIVNTDIVNVNDALVFFDDSTQDQAAIPNDITWGIKTSNYTGNSFSVTTQGTSPTAAFFKPDGLRSLVIDAVANIVSQYDLTVEWDASTASFTQSFDLSNECNFPRGMYARHDGLKLYVADSGPTDNVFEYDMTTAWDVSTMSFSGNSFNISSQDTVPTGLSFKPDGLKMFTIGNTNDNVSEYALTTAWDVTTASFTQFFDVSPLITNPLDMAFKPNGKGVYIVGNVTNNIFQFELTTAWDVSTMRYNSKFFNIVAEDNSSTGIALKPDGSKFYLVGSQNNAIFEYDIGINVEGNAFLEGLASGYESTGVSVTSTGGTIIGCTATSITITISSADILVIGKRFVVTDESGTPSGGSPITIATEGSETISGAATQTITSGFGSICMYSNGTNLFICAEV